MAVWGVAVESSIIERGNGGCVRRLGRWAWGGGSQKNRRGYVVISVDRGSWGGRGIVLFYDFRLSGRAWCRSG